MRVLLAAAALALTGAVAVAQDFVPDNHYVVSRHADFPGGDIASIFDTTLEACESACSNEQACVAYTFNQNSNSCFLKNTVEESSFYEGAISAQRYPASQTVKIVAANRATDLMSVLSEGDFETARTLAAHLGRYYSTDGNDPAQLVALAQTIGDPNIALRYLGAALAVTDDARLWLQFAEVSRRSDVSFRAFGATINGYLRAPDDATRVEALIALSRSLESMRRGRDMIPVLRLANDILPSRETEALLDEAIGKYGFRVTDTAVQNTGEIPRICATFNEPLVRTGVDYAPFVQTHVDGLTVDTEGSNLCLVGVQYGERYSFTLRSGLPAASGQELQRSTELTLYVRDRDPLIQFPSNAYVLPRLGDMAIPIQTVNVDEVDLTLRYMTDRSLIEAIRRDLFRASLSSYPGSWFDDTFGEVIWTGVADVGNDLNADVLTRIPLATALEGQPTGVYALTASLPDEGGDPQTQWFIVSDLGLSTMLGDDGLTVQARSFGDTSPVGGVAVTLLSEANAILGETTTDADGVARFDAGLTRGKGSARPAMVIATHADDLSFVSLRGAAFDLSDRGVEGREPAGPMDVFLTTDRGAYHAGDTIFATALMRDAEALALTDVPLTAILRRPDGVEYLRTTSLADRAGGHVFDLSVATTAPRGTWRVEVLADLNAAPLARTTVLVEDFLPERIDFTLTVPDGLRAQESPSIDIEARYLFGPPAPDLTVEGESILRAATSVDGFEGYRFGRYDERFEPVSSYIGGEPTDDEGHTTAELDLTTYGPATRPLTLQANVRLTEGSGRPVERHITAPVLPETEIIGIKPQFDGALPEGTTARFDLIALSPDLDGTDMAVNWTVNRLTTHYQWYQLNNRWEWNRVTLREPIASGYSDLSGDPTEVAANLTWGRYEVVVENSLDAEIATSMSFYAGWYVPDDPSKTPDFLELSLDSETYVAEDTAQLRIVPRYAGTALVSVLSNHVIYMDAVEVTAGENLIPIDVTSEWGAGAYVTATVIRPMDVAAGHNPARAMGVAYASIDPGDMALDVTLDVAEQIQPRQPMTIGVHVDGVREGDTAWVTVAAVDLGILNLTGFKAPDPQDYYFGQRKLGVELRDLYGDLIDGLNGSLGAVRSGGGFSAASGEAPPPPEELVTFFEGPVQVGPDGMAQVSFDVPAFNGTLRVMAVAWSEKGVGQASQDVIVRDPIVLTLSAPRFLAPNDQSRVLMELTHTDGPAGDVGIEVEADGVLITDAAIPASVTLEEGGRASLSLPITAVDAGVHQLTVVLTTPDGQRLEKALTVPVVLNDPQISRQTRVSLDAGASFVFDSQIFAGLVEGSGDAMLSVGPQAHYDVPGMLRLLDRYPYRCTEQMTSRAMPMLYFAKEMEALGIADQGDVQVHVDDAVRDILGRQTDEGDFELWSGYGGSMWLDAYVTDFLSRARVTGHEVPDLAFSIAIDNLRNQVNYYPDFDQSGGDLAYALLVLAREGAAQIGDLRYYADQKAGDFATPLAQAQLGAALSQYGEQERADRMFATAGTRLAADIRAEARDDWRADYGSYRRDAAAILALAAETGSALPEREMITGYATRSRDWVSTQEAVWSLMAAGAEMQSLAHSGVTFDGSAPESPLLRMQSGDKAVVVSNGSADPVDLTFTTVGVPKVPEPAGGKDFTISRRYYSLEGTPIDATRVEVGARMVVVLSITPMGYQQANLMVNDPLPAGFEIDNPNLLQGGQIGALDWLDIPYTQSTEFRTDRFLAAVERHSDEAFQLAYIVRAVSPGGFRHPAALVEDMYRPERRAWTDTGSVTIVE